jgi:probable phosphoglycerate mutase
VTGLRLVLARHGQTDANIRLVLDSLPPGPPLTELGRRQAAELADELAVAPVVGVYASTAIRAQQTAEPVAARHGLAVEVVDGLQEVFLGDLDGTVGRESLERFIAVARAWQAGDLDRPMPGGESATEAIARFTAAIGGIQRRHAHGVIVVITHGAIVEVAVPRLAPNLLELPTRPLMPNAGQIVLDQDDATSTGWRCVAWPGLLLT